MNLIIKAFQAYSQKARSKRASIFLNSFSLDENTKILDLGSETGSNINAILKNTSVNPTNVYIADIDSALIEEGRDRFGYNPILVDESGKLPFSDGFFDIVYCSSVIEHVTVPKEQIWSMYSGKEFEAKASIRQNEFAREIQRLGKQYFVQTPYKYFPIESHSWLPLIALLSRRLQISVLRLTNSFWVKKTTPDWYLLNKRQMAKLFGDANIANEKSFGLTKSVMAIKSSSSLQVN